MGRQPCCDKVGLKRGPWTIEEDHKLMNFVVNNGIQCWRTVPKLADLLRCGKSCRLRWINYLRPDLKRGALSETEENQIIELHARLGNRSWSQSNIFSTNFISWHILNKIQILYRRWSKIASHIPGRTDNEIKNHWNTRIKKRLKLLGLDPVSHQPKDQTEEQFEQNTKAIAKSNSSRLEEEQKILDVTQEKVDKKGAEAVANIKQNDQMAMTTIDTPYPLSNSKMLSESLDMGPIWMMNQETNPPNSYSPSLSMDSINPSAGESSSIQDDTSLQQLVDSVDSILSWDCFN